LGIGPSPSWPSNPGGCCTLVVVEEINKCPWSYCPQLISLSNTCRFQFDWYYYN